MKINLGIGQKVLVVLVGILVVFTLGLAVLVGTTSFNNLSAVKQAELNRMSQILAAQITEMETDMAAIATSFEESEPIASEIKLITNLGPYYADPASYFSDDFINIGAFIDSADQVYVFEAQLKLIQTLQATQKLNDLSSISFYMASPFSLVSQAQPVLSFRLDQDFIYLNRFARKGTLNDRLTYQIQADQFRPPAPDFFDISSAYSAPAEEFFTASNFTPILSRLDTEIFSNDWLLPDSTRSQIIIKNNLPVLQTWYPVKLPLPHPDTWQEENVVVGLVLIEKQLAPPIIASLKRQLGLDIGFSQQDRLIISSLDVGPESAPPITAGSDTIALGPDQYYFALQPVTFSEDRLTDFQAIIFSPVSELAQFTQILRSQIMLVSIGAILLIGFVTYMSLQYLVNRPLSELTRTARQIAAGNLTQKAVVKSQDELGLLGHTFNQMADQLRELIDSLEQRVAARTRRLEIVASLGEQLSAILKVDDLLQTVVDQVKTNFGYYHAHIYLFNEARTRLVVAAGTGPAGRQMQLKGHNIPFDAPASLVARAARGNEIVNVDNVREAEDWLPNALLPDTYSEMAVPIVLAATGQVVGVLDVQQNKIAGFDDSDANLLRSLANQVAVAINNARLFTEVESALAEAQAIQEKYVEQSWSKTKIATRSAQYDHTRAGMPAPPPTDMAAIKPQILSQTQPALITLPQPADAADLSTPAPPVLATPVLLRHKPIGIIQVHPGDNTPSWSNDDMAVLAAVMDELAQTAEKLRLFDETRQRANFDRAVSEISQQLRQAPSIDLLAKTAAEALGKVMGSRGSLVKIGPPTQESPVEGGNGKH